jgi:NAD(P)-dependent dehydrogenase (short-subunit alcohol dehydrogenase family)
MIRLKAAEFPRGNRQHQRTRGLLVLADEQLFATRDVDSVTVDQIVDTAEVAKGSFLIIVQTVIEKTGRVDVLGNSIGNGTIGAVEEISEPEARIVVKDVFWSAARMIQAVLPTMRAQGGGRIVSKSSLGGLMGLRSAPSKVP